MHAVVVRSTIEDFEEGRKFLRDEAIPRFSQVPGFVCGYWVKLDDSSGASMIVFETEEAAQAMAEMLRINAPPMVTPTSIEVGEVQEHA